MLPAQRLLDLQRGAAQIGAVDDHREAFTVARQKLLPQLAHAERIGGPQEHRRLAFQQVPPARGIVAEAHVEIDERHDIGGTRRDSQTGSATPVPLAAAGVLPTMRATRQAPVPWAPAPGISIQ